MNSAALVYFASDVPPEASVLAIDDGLERHNRSVAPLDDVKPLASFASEASGLVVGGAVGRTWGRCCELLQLWVEPGHRASGVGTRLLQQFEKSARSRGCNVFYLTTLSFQAPDFYRKQGYVSLAEISGYPNGITKYLMGKTSMSDTENAATQSCPTADYFRALEKERTLALVAQDMETAERLHARDYQLITPTGKVFSRESYLSAIAASPFYARWDVGVMDVRLSPKMAIVRYQARLEFPSGKVVTCWHTDSYEQEDGQWRAVWSQATVTPQVTSTS